MKKQSSAAGRILADTAKSLAARNVNSACFYWLYQPTVPEKVAEKLKNK